MDKSLDMSLDDIIKSKKSAGRARGGGLSRGGGGGARRSFTGEKVRVGGARRSFIGERVRDTRRGAGRKRPLGVNAPSSSFSIAKSSRRTKNFPLQHELFQEGLAAVGLPSIESGTKLYLSNLGYGVSNDDIRELFSEFGELKRYAIHFDKNGQPSGVAEVVYKKRSDAFAAYKSYNNVLLDGRLMKIEVVSPNSGLPVSARVNVVGGANGKSSRRVVLTKNVGRTFSSAPGGFGQTQIWGEGQQQRRRGGLRNGNRQGQTQNRGEGQRQRRRQSHGKKKHVEKSSDELDKELEKYHSESMQIS